MKFLYLSGGFASLGLGIIGIILPILPTTPFLLLTAFLFSKGSDKYKNWFTSTILYQKYLSNFIEHQTMTRIQKWTLLLTVDFLLLISFILMQSSLLKLLIVFILIIKHWYFYKFIKLAEAN